MDVSTYIALLRGINVGGHNLIKMDALRESFQALGLDNVQTYLQSGNVVFNAPKKSETALVGKLQAKILRDFGCSAVVIIRSAEEISQVIKKNPFLKEKGIDVSRLHVAFLSRAPEKAALKALEAFPASSDRFRCSGRDIYLHYPNGSGKAELSNSVLEKMLSVSATTRNWNTVNKLAATSSE